MCDFSDDFDDFDEDSFKDAYDDDFEMEEAAENDLESAGEATNGNTCEDKFTVEDSAILGGAMSYAFEEGLRERKRRKLKKFSDDLEKT